MGQRAIPLVKTAPLPPIDSTAILNALPEPVFVVDGSDCIRAVNQAAEHLFDSSATALIGRRIRDLIPADSPLIALIDQVRNTGSSMSEYGITLETPRIGSHFISAGAAPIAEAPDCVVVSILQLSIARMIDQQLTHRGAARSVTAMAAMLAHEVKNPLSGIRGAAQLLERNASAEDLQLTRLICEEADRIVGLVNRMEMFSDQRPIERSAVNIHQVLEHVRRVAESGFARGRRVIEAYDPSLPPVYGNRDLLIQVFLNLVKNAAEATPESDGTIVLTTRYQHGVRLAAPGSQSRVHLPLLISVQDNGHGIPEDLSPHLFDPFVTTKIGGKGLGLALVAKIVGDHGGVVEFSGEPRRTVFSVRLPMASVPGALE